MTKAVMQPDRGGRRAGRIGKKQKGEVQMIETEKIGQPILHVNDAAAAQLRKRQNKPKVTFLWKGEEQTLYVRVPQGKACEIDGSGAFLVLVNPVPKDDIIQWTFLGGRTVEARRARGSCDAPDTCGLPSDVLPRRGQIHPVGVARRYRRNFDSRRVP
jgi:hypothetical protein